MKAGQGQTLIDVAAQECGSAEVAWEIAVRSGLSLTDTPGATELELPIDGGDSDTAAAMAAIGARPATDSETESVDVRAIGNATIGTDRIC